MDDYSHIDTTVFYVSESIPGPLQADTQYSNLINEYNSQITQCCNCADVCSQDCCCIKLCRTSMGQNNQNKDLHTTYDYNANGYILECNDMCTCSESCSNRIVQRGPIKNLEIRICSNKNKGYGLFTETLIPKGTFICEYAGEIITKSEAQRRHYFNNVYNKMNYIYSLKEVINNTYIETFIDPSIFGNIGRYINHSCNPNTVVIPVRINSPIPKLAIFSCCEINSGCEITFSYGQNKLVGFKSQNLDSAKVCLCESSQCKGTLPFNPD